MSIEQQLEDLIAARENASRSVSSYLEGCYQKACDDLVFVQLAEDFAATAAPQLLARLKRYEEALRFNQAVFELFTEVGNGDIGATELSDMTNKAIALTNEVLEARGE